MMGVCIIPPWSCMQQQQLTHRYTLRGKAVCASLVVRKQAEVHIQCIVVRAACYLQAQHATCIQPHNSQNPQPNRLVAACFCAVWPLQYLHSSAWQETASCSAGLMSHVLRAVTGKSEISLHCNYLGKKFDSVLLNCACMTVYTDTIYSNSTHGCCATECSWVLH